MHHDHLDDWRHSHRFGQDKKRAGERKTLLVVALTLGMMIWEIVAGIAYGSMALLADGLHMGSHATALGIAFFAYVYARRHAGSARFSFGTGKVNALGGFAGAILLAAFALYMVIESVGRLLSPVDISFNGAILVAVFGLAVNGLSAWILGEDGHHHDQTGEAGHADNDHADAAAAADHGHSHGHHDHNRRAAYLHVLADALTSLLAIVALLAGKYLGWFWLDPVMGLVGAVLVTHWSWGLLQETAAVLLDRQHAALEQQVRIAVEDNDVAICDLHLWSIGTGIHAAIVSLVAHAPAEPAIYRDRIRARCPSIVHVTVEPQVCHHGHTPHPA